MKSKFNILHFVEPLLNRKLDYKYTFSNWRILYLTNVSFLTEEWCRVNKSGTKAEQWAYGKHGCKIIAIVLEVFKMQLLEGILVFMLLIPTAITKRMYWLHHFKWLLLMAINERSFWIQLCIYIYFFVGYNYKL